MISISWPPVYNVYGDRLRVDDFNLLRLCYTASRDESPRLAAARAISEAGNVSIIKGG